MHEIRQSANGACERGDLAGGTDSDLLAVRHAEIEQLRIDLRRGGGDVRPEPRRGEKLSVDEPRMVDGEEQSAKAACLHDFDVDPLGQHRDRAAADELLVARLREQRLADREKDDHDGDAEAVAKQQEQRAPRTHREVPKGKDGVHALAARLRSSTITPSRM